MGSLFQLENVHFKGIKERAFKHWRGTRLLPLRNKDSFVGCLGWGQGCLPRKKHGGGVMRGQPALLVGGDPIPHDTELELQPEDCGPRD